MNTVQRIASRLSQVQAMHVDFRMHERDIAEDVEEVAYIAKRLGRRVKVIKTDQPGVELLAFPDPHDRHHLFIAVRHGDKIVGFVKFDHEPVGHPGRRYNKLLTPHSAFLPRARGKGYASSIYRWALNQGLCFLSSGIQSPAANSMWSHLAKSYPWFLVSSQPYLKFLGDGKKVSRRVLNTYDTRLVLLGKGWTVEKFCRAFDVRGYNGQ